MGTVIVGTLRCILALSYNHIHKVLRIIELANFPFTTSGTKCD